MKSLVFPIIGSLVIGGGAITAPIYAPFIEKAVEDNKEPGPIPPHDYSLDPLTFEALTDDVYVYISNEPEDEDRNLIPNLYYSIDNGPAMEYIIVPDDAGAEVRVPKGSKIQFWGNNPNGWCFFNDTDHDVSNIIYFFGDDDGALVNASGNIMSLISATNWNDATVPCEGCFKGLFDCCFDEGIVSAKNMIFPDQVTDWCFHQMFKQNYTLVEPPQCLPASNLKKYCYCEMFEICYALEYVPVIEAVKLDVGCCNGMFGFCSKLNVSQDSGDNLFWDLTGLSTLPKDATSSMFSYTASDVKVEAGHKYYWNK